MRIVILTVLIILSGCASVEEKPFLMETSTFIPSEKYYKGGNYSVFVSTNNSLSAKDNVRVDLHKLTKSMVERTLLSIGNINLTRTKNKSDYIVESILETANYGHKIIDSKKYHIVTISGRVRIYKRKMLQLIKDIPFNENAREVSIHSNSRDTIYREALHASIGVGVHGELEKFFSPKGLILDGVKAGGNYHLRARLNSGLVEIDDKVEIYAIEILNSQLLEAREVNHIKLCNGKVIDNSNSSIIIVSVDSDCAVKKGHYVSKTIEISLVNKTINFIDKGLNKILRKN